VSYEFLSQLVGEYLLTSCKDVDISAALSMMPSTTGMPGMNFRFIETDAHTQQEGMDLNPLFTDAKSFRPAGDGGELKLFEQAGIQLVHGWLVDPGSPEFKTVTKFEDYDSAVNLIADADHTTKGQLVEVAGSYESGSFGAADNYTDEERQKIEHGKL
jgi:ubiquitin carboxyl-terminal hydrolase MINDY-1/2